MGDLFRQYWMPALLAEELPENDCSAGAGEAAVGAPARLPGQRGPLRPDRRVLRAPRRLAVVRPQRGVRPALPVPRLEVRRHRPVRRGALGAGQQQLLRRTSSSPRTRWSRSATCCGPTWATRPRSLPCRSSSSRRCPPEQTYTSKRWQECNWLQALEGGIDSSHVSCLHSGGLKTDPLFKGAKGNEYNLNDTQAVLRGRRRPRAGCSSAPAATPRRAATTGGSRRG